MVMNGLIVTVIGVNAARPRFRYNRYSATPHSTGEAQTSCKLAKVRQIFSVSVDINVIATAGRSVDELLPVTLIMTH